MLNQKFLFSEINIGEIDLFNVYHRHCFSVKLLLEIYKLFKLFQLFQFLDRVGTLFYKEFNKKGANCFWQLQLTTTEFFFSN